MLKSTNIQRCLWTSLSDCQISIPCNPSPPGTNLGEFSKPPGGPMELPPEIPVPVELTQLAAASVQDEWCQLLILREQVGAEVTIDDWRLTLQKIKVTERSANLNWCRIWILPWKRTCSLKINGRKMSFPTEIVPFLGGHLGFRWSTRGEQKWKNPGGSQSAGHLELRLRGERSRQHTGSIWRR